MTTTYQTNLTDETYNGWTNSETWNVVLWIMNDESLYYTARNAANVYPSNPYQYFIDEMHDCVCSATPDGVEWQDERVNQVAVNEALAELADA